MTVPLDVLDEIPPEQIGAAIIRLSGRLLAPPAPAEDALLTVAQVAARLGVAPRYVYRNARALGVVRLSRRSIRFRPAAVDRIRAALERRRDDGEGWKR